MCQTGHNHLGEAAGWERMIRAVRLVRGRLARATSLLEQDGIRYAVIGANAVAAHVAKVDEGAVRNTPDVDILLRRDEFPAAIAALEQGNFVHSLLDGTHLFLDGHQGRVRDAVYVYPAEEKLSGKNIEPAPDVADAERTRDGWFVISLEALVRMKLDSFREIDRVHLRDMIEVGLIDATWKTKLPPPLAERLQHLFDTPDG